jgi:uncharacterized protein
MNIEYKQEYLYFTHVYLNVTDDCNLTCPYCFTNQSPNYMTLDTAKKVIDQVYENFFIKMKILTYQKMPEKICIIHFFGGEPLLCYDSIIVPLIEYCKTEKNDIFIFKITTNGTLLDDEKINFFLLNNVEIFLSIDGNKETQNFNRPCKDQTSSSFDLINNNLEYLLERFPDITFRSTIYAPTVHNLFNNYKFAKEKGFKRYLAIPDRITDLWTEEKKLILKNEINKIYQYYINDNSLFCQKIE